MYLLIIFLIRSIGYEKLDLSKKSAIDCIFNIERLKSIVNENEKSIVNEKVNKKYNYPEINFDL